MAELHQNDITTATQKTSVNYNFQPHTFQTSDGASIFVTDTCCKSLRQKTDNSLEFLSLQGANLARPSCTHYHLTASP